MIVAAWVLLVFFGFWGLMFLGAMFDPKIKSLNFPLFVFVVVIIAISAGVIWGGLFK